MSKVETMNVAVAQVANLLFRRLAVGRASNPGVACGLPIRDTADCQSALPHRKARSLFPLAAAFAVSLAVIGCQVAPKSIAPTTPGATNTAARVAAPPSADGIPARPEALKYPPLTYEPPAPEQFRVALKSGPVAYVVPDRELPLVNIVISIHAGDFLDPAGKEGLAGLTGYLLARGGAGTNTAEELEERLAFLAANLDSGIGGPQGSVSLNLLSKDLDEGLEIVRDVLTAPRFQDDKISLRKQQALQAMKERNDDSANIEGREAGFLAYGENFWMNRHSTAASVESISRADIEAFHKDWFNPSNFVVAVSGDFDRDVMLRKIEVLFANWPFAGQPPVPVPTNTAFAAPGIYLLNKPDVNQGRVSILLPGITRDNPDFFAVQVMNDILGGGGFTSRIMNRVRSDEGLAYSASSRFQGGAYFPLAFTAGFQTKSRTVAYATSLVLEEIRRIAAEPVSEMELNTSQRGFIDRFPRAFSTKAQVAAIFAQDEFSGRFARDPGYWKSYRSRIGAVTRDDIQRVAKKYLTPDKVAILAVGKKDDILLGYPTHPVKLQDLSGGPITDLPLRDPLTMKPLPLADESRTPAQ